MNASIDRKLDGILGEVGIAEVGQDRLAAAIDNHVRLFRCCRQRRQDERQVVRSIRFIIKLLSSISSFV